MRTLVISDIHDQRVNSTIKILERLIKFENPEKLVFLGDCDFPSIYKFLLDLEKRIAIGNHEYALVNGLSLDSLFFEFPPQGYIDEWGKFPDLKRFVLENSNKIKRTA